MSLTVLQIATEKFRNGLARDLANDIIDASTNTYINPDNYFVFFGRNQVWPNNDVTVIPPTDADETRVDTYQNMIAGKIVTDADVALMIPRHDWVSNTIYTMFTDDNTNLFAQSFFAVVNAVSTYYVYKCLYNANGAPSTVQPTFSDTNASDPSFETSDGYVWKYMYTINEANFLNFATSDFLPVIPDANVSGNAVSGAIDIITVPSQGYGYGNYLEGIFNAPDIQVGGNNLIYAVPNTAVATNSYYNQCILYITDGTGSGQFRNVVTYRVLGLVKEVILDSPFSTIPDVTSTYQITPSVKVTGDGRQTINCIARALINAFSANSVWGVDVVQRGVGYRQAVATVLADASVGVSQAANLHVIIPPLGGHGYDAAKELGATQTCISVKFSNTESNTITINNSYRQAGLLKNPHWANVALTVFNSSNSAGTNGRFVLNEEIAQIHPVYMMGNVSVVQGNSQVVGSGTDFLNQLQPNDFIFINGGTTNTYFGTVNNIVNSSLLYTSSNVLFTSTNATFSQAIVITTGIITSINVPTINVANVPNEFLVGSLIVGNTTGATAFVNSYMISGQVKTFNTFQQMIGYVGTLTSGTFLENEAVYQGNTTAANAIFHSMGNSTILYVTDQFGVFANGGTITGSNSSAVFSISGGSIPGDMTIDSGDVLYLENFSAVSRSPIQTEQIRIIFEF